MNDDGEFDDEQLNIGNLESDDELFGNENLESDDSDGPVHSAGNSDNGLPEYGANLGTGNGADAITISDSEADDREEADEEADEEVDEEVDDEPELPAEEPEGDQHIPGNNNDGDASPPTPGGSQNNNHGDSEAGNNTEAADSESDSDLDGFGNHIPPFESDPVDGGDDDSDFQSIYASDEDILPGLAGDIDTDEERDVNPSTTRRTWRTRRCRHYCKTWWTAQRHKSLHRKQRIRRLKEMNNALRRTVRAQASRIRLLEHRLNIKLNGLGRNRIVCALIPITCFIPGLSLTNVSRYGIAFSTIG